MDRRSFLRQGTLVLAAASCGQFAGAAIRRPPNFIVILCDDLGYGDIAAFGAKRIRTPHLDRMARESTVLTDFYSAANLCTPSRAGLLTGRYPIRNGLGYEVIIANDSRGLPQSEVTLAEALPPEYATALIGKWHLGHVAPYWPSTQQGFDLFFGLPYSHDIEPLSLYESSAPGVDFTKEDVDFPQLQQRFYARAERFIEEHRDRPFFLDLALSAPHLPSYPHPDHEGHSRAGSFGDVVEEVDALVGKLLAKLKALGLERDTLVIFTSDNGPWFERSPGTFRGRKGGGASDGGYRVPFIVRQPGVVPAGQTVGSIAMAIDQLLLFDNENIAGIRTQRWKYVVSEYQRSSSVRLEGRGYPQLYDMQAVEAEHYSMAARYPDILKEMQQRMEHARTAFDPLKAKEIPEPRRSLSSGTVGTLTRGRSGARSLPMTHTN